MLVTIQFGILPSRLTTQGTINIYKIAGRTMILLVVLYGKETWSLALKYRMRDWLPKEGICSI
jgi:hypothetical protein